MTRRVLTFSVIAAAVLSVLSAQALAAGAAKEPARVHYSEAGQALAWLGADAPQAALNKLLSAQGANARTLATLQLQASRPGRNGVVHYRFSQSVGGLPVHGAYAQMSVAGDGRIVHLIDRVARVPAALPGASKIDAARALQLAMAHLHPGVATSLKVVAQEGATTRFEGGSFFYEAPRVTPVVVGMDDGSMARAWLVSTWSDKKNLLNHTVVGGDGKVLVVQPLTASDQYNVFLVDPGKGPQTIVNGPGAGNAESPAGWLSPKIQKTTNISGNNVSAYLDTDANNSPDKGGKFVRKQQFLTAVDLGTQPSTATNQAVAVQNLFYLNNVVHDILYKHGFTEVVGNFQIDNFGKGGKGNDPVKAEAQDGSGTNNANFATPPDGTSPRMQMFLWSPAIPPQEVVVNSPVSARFDAYSAGFGPGLDGTGLSGAIVNTTPADGCTAIGNNVSGAIALIDRGSCNFTVKVKNAQNAGAAAAIIANNQGGNTFVVMGGTDDTITIPSVSVTQNDGATLHAMAAPTGIVRSKTPAPPNIDGDLDSGVVYHEYGHGLTYRMIGNMSGPLAGALGEGASDVNAFMINNDPVLGTYAASNPRGIRRYSYAGYPLTYADVNGFEVHNDGEIYAGAMWRVKELFGDNRREELYSTWVDGMNYTPSQPTFEQMRDGLLQAVSVGPTPGDLCTVWAAFAQFGIGVGSSAVINADGSVTTSPSFAVPQQCIALRAGGR